MRMCPPGTSWYSRESLQQIASGSHRGTVIAIVPPGRRTRTSSSRAWRSAGTCSRISAATTRSNSPSPKGSESASPSLTSASAPSGTSPASAIATNISRTCDSSSASWSKATTSAPRRYISKACRPAPQPMSSTRSPGRSPRRSKSTVSTGLLLRGGVVFVVVGGDGLVVDLRHRGGHGAPAEQLVDAGPAVGAHPGAPLGVVEQRRDGGLELAHVARGDQVGAVAVRADDLGDRAGTRHDERRTAGHQLRGGQREALVEAGHAGELRRAHELDQLRVADAVDEPDRVGDRQLVDQLLGAAARLGGRDQDELDVALGADLGERLEEGGDALHGGVGAGHG